MSRPDSITQAFLNDLGRYPLLTAEQELVLGRQIQERRRLLQLEEEGKRLTPKERRAVRLGERARDQMVNCNLRLVVNVAKKYLNRVSHMTLLDLVQEGAIGLMRGAELFDPARGYKFSTYAYWWIRQGICRGTHTQENTIRMPVSVAERQAKLRATAQRMMQELMREPTKAELAEAMDMKEQELELMLMRGQRLTSLDSTVNKEEGSTYGEVLPDPRSLDKDEDFLLDDFLKLQVVLDYLDPRERQILEMRHGIGDVPPLTTMQMARELGVSRQRVLQLEERAVRKCKVAIRQVSPLSGPRTRPQPQPPAESVSHCKKWVTIGGFSGFV